MKPLSSDRNISVAEAEPRSPHLTLVARWLNENWGRSQGYDLPQTLAWCRHLTSSGTETLFVATRGRQPVGTAAAVKCDLQGYEELTPWLSSLFVSSEERGRSTGRSLVRAACDWARQRGHESLYLYARRGRLIDYYGALGWMPFKELALPKARYLIMRKPLGCAER